jgi:hypothetical protein
MVSKQVGLQVTPLGLVKFITDIGCSGGENEPAVDLNAMAEVTAPVPLVATVGAVPLVAFKYSPSPSGRVVYGELQAFQLDALLACILWIITSVPLRVSPTPGQAVVQEVETVVPAVSKDAVEPGGGSNSKKLAPRIAPEPPERLNVIELVPAVPVRLYAKSTLRAGVELKM